MEEPTKKYIRGPYKSYKSRKIEKYAKAKTSKEDTERLIDILKETREKINSELDFSEYKSKTISTIQQLIDCFRKSIKREEEQIIKELRQRIISLEKENKELLDGNLFSLLEDSSETNQLIEFELDLECETSHKKSGPLEWYQSRVNSADDQEISKK